MFSTNRQAAKLFACVLIAFSTLLFLNFSVKAQTMQSIEEVVKSISGGKLEVETKAVPYQLVGDFNGDKIKDIAVIVRFSDSVANIKKKVKVDYLCGTPQPCANEVSTDGLALLIIHGAGKGWQSAQKSSVLLLGRNNVMSFQKSRLGEAGEAMEIQKDRHGRTSIIFSTEASEGILKWNGKKYTWTETEP